MTIISDEKLLDEIRKGPTGRKIAGELERRWLDERRQAVGEIEVARAELTEALPDLQKAEDAARAELETARKALKDAEGRFLKAQRDRQGAAREFDRRRDQAEAQLRRTAPAEIDNFIREMHDLWQSVRVKGISIRPGGRHWFTGERKPDTSNIEQRRECLSAITDVRCAAEDLKLRALSREATLSELEKLRGGIPDTGR